MEVPGLAQPRGSRAQPWPGSCSQLLPPAGPSHVLSVTPSFGTASRVLFLEEALPTHASLAQAAGEGSRESW